MFVHPNTFRYRLRRLTEVSGIDLADPDQRFAAMLQLRAVYPDGPRTRLPRRVTEVSGTYLADPGQRSPTCAPRPCRDHGPSAGAGRGCRTGAAVTALAASGW
jgi:hypothetical protein